MNEHDDHQPHDPENGEASGDGDPSLAPAVKQSWAREALRQALADETKDQARRLTRELVLARLAPPGSDAFVDREGRLFDGLIQTGWVLGRASKMSGIDGPEDVAQRVHLRLMIDFREGRLFAINRGYVETTVDFDVKTQWRKSTPVSLSEEAEMAIASQDTFSDDELADVERRLDRAWQRLSDRDRQVLSMRFPNLLSAETTASQNGELSDHWNAGRKLKDIAAEMSVSVPTIHRFKTNAVERLAAGLREEGLDELAELLVNEMM